MEPRADRGLIRIRRGEGNPPAWTQLWTQTTQDAALQSEISWFSERQQTPVMTTHRYRAAPAGTRPVVFQDRCLKPLGHPSVFEVQRLSRGVGPGKASIASGRHSRQPDDCTDRLAPGIARTRRSLGVGLAG